MTLIIEAIVRAGSEVVGKSVEEINNEYEVFILTSQRKIGSQVERKNVNPWRTIKENDRIEFKGDNIDKVMELFEKCESPI